MEINSAKIKVKSNASSKMLTEIDLESLSLDDMNNRNNRTKSIRRTRKFSSLSVNTTSTKEEQDEPTSAQYNLKDHYDIIDTLGMGTYSYVRLAVDIKTGKKVAIKTSRGDNSREMLKNEYNLLKRLSDDNIVKVYDFIEKGDKNESFLIMEYFEGQTLEEYALENGPVSEDSAKYILSQLLASIQSLHELNIAHRDIKPENILINSENDIKIIDFNISKAGNSSDASSGSSAKSKFMSTFYTQMCSPLYAAPELKNRYGYTESIDIWGAGVVLFVGLFGSLKEHSVAELKTAGERGEKLRGIVINNKTLSQECSEFLLSMLSFSPEDRPTASEALDNKWCNPNL